jgi:hypothetical protein
MTSKTYKRTTYIKGYTFDGTHESAKFIIEKIKEFSTPAFKRIVYQQNLIDDTIKFEYYGSKITQGDFIELGSHGDPNDVGIWTSKDLERLKYILEE